MSEEPKVKPTAVIVFNFNAPATEAEIGRMHVRAERAARRRFGEHRGSYRDAATQDK